MFSISMFIKNCLMGKKCLILFTLCGCDKCALTCSCMSRGIFSKFCCFIHSWFACKIRLLCVDVTVSKSTGHYTCITCFEFGKTVVKPYQLMQIPFRDVTINQAFFVVPLLWRGMHIHQKGWVPVCPTASRSNELLASVWFGVKLWVTDYSWNGRRGDNFL